MIDHLRRLLRVYAPSAALPERIVFHGAVFTLVPRVAPTEATPAQHQAWEEESRREGPTGQEAVERGSSQPDPGERAAPPSRTRQIRYLFLSWLHLITTTGYWTHQDGGHPEQFLDPFTPYVPGGLVRPEEVVAAAEELVAGGFAPWVDKPPRPLILTDAGLRHAEPPWRLILADAGVRHAEHEQGSDE